MYSLLNQESFISWALGALYIDFLDELLSS